MTLATSVAMLGDVSGDIEFLAWHRSGSSGACVVMTGGVSVTRSEVRTVREQVSGSSAALSFGGTLPVSIPIGLQIWRFALPGGHVLKVAASERMAAAIARSPLAAGRPVPCHSGSSLLLGRRGC